jgi:hypothetical protein
MNAPAPAHWDLLRNPAGQWCLEADGVLHERVVVARAFPISAPEGPVCVLDADSHELLWLEDPAVLDERLKERVAAALNSREFTPVIEAILAIGSLSTPSRWTVRTDRGITDLLLPGEEALQRVGGKSLLVADAAGVQYLIRDIPSLDRASRKFLERFL